MKHKLSFPIIAFLLGCVIAASGVVNAQGDRLLPSPEVEELPRAKMGLRGPQLDNHQSAPRHDLHDSPADCVARARVVTMESLNFPGHFLRHSFHSAVLGKYEHNKQFAKDSSFIIRPGLAGVGASFESVNFPGHFLRHSGYSMVLHKDDGSRQFSDDATFHMDRGLAGRSGISLQPINLKGYFVRHYGYRFIVSRYDRSRTFAEDATLLLR